MYYPFTRITLLLLSAWLCWGPPLLANSDEIAEAHELFATAVAARNNGDLNAAVAGFTQVIDEYPGVIEAYLNLAALAANDGDLQSARQYLLDGLKSHPDYARLFDNLSKVHAALAAQAYNKALPDGNKSAPLLALDWIEQPGASSDLNTGIRQLQQTVVDSQQALTTLNQQYAQQLNELQNQLPELADSITEAQIIARVQSWAAAFMARDLDAYMSHYKLTYQPPGRGKSHAQWHRNIQSRLSSAEPIKVELSDFQPSWRGNIATIRFTQRDAFDNTQTKQLKLRRLDDDWSNAVIEQEQVIP